MPDDRELGERYLERLALGPSRARALQGSLESSGLRAGLANLHGVLAETDANSKNPALGSMPSRLNLACGLQHASPPPLLAPQPNRGSMVPHPWLPLNPVSRLLRSLLRRRRDWVERKTDNSQRRAWPAPMPEEVDEVDAPDPHGRWQAWGNFRRIVLLALMFAQTALATEFMSKVLPYQGKAPIEIAILILFAILFCWVSAGFWTAMTGFLVILRGTDRYIISRQTEAGTAIDPSARTALVMPICNEDVPRVMAGLRATYESLARTGELAHFDFFVLSDSNESDTCTAEIGAWASLCREVGGFGRIFYRRRRRRVKRKSGNIDDFCRRWGKNYRYMIVLDADSVMSGECVTSLVRMMEANPGAGIIQSAPIAAGRDTLYARIQQFSTRVYGPLFTAGLHYWQLGESHYWGHNAIIRVAPFMRHCALAPLPGRGSLAGEILSHDFVEASLMRRAGWAVWIAYDLAGSYEEMPPNLLDELKRDRRWCHGNLMNFRLFLARGMHPVHRAVFLTGVLAYLSAPLWFLFLAMSTGLLAVHTLVEPQYFVRPWQLFPIWPQWHPEKAVALFSATATLLFLPKLLSVLAICMHGAREFGGRLRLTASMLLELLFSMALAPVRMLFHTRFVVAAFLGWAVRWKSPPREDTETTWGEGFRKHGLHMLLGLTWGAGVYWLNPSFLPWLLPIAGSLALSVPLSVWSSRVSLGRASRKAGLFSIPEEVHPPIELRDTFEFAHGPSTLPGFIDAVVDPLLNAIVCHGAHVRRLRPPITREARKALLYRALHDGPGGLTEAERLQLMDDAWLLSRLHFEAWTSERTHPEWRNRMCRAADRKPQTEPA